MMEIFGLSREVLAEYDIFRTERIQQHANKGRGHKSYISSKICNEFIQVIGEQILRQIIFEIKTAKYYAVIVESTSDISYIDQQTQIFHYVLPTRLVERFLSCIPIYGHPGSSKKYLQLF